MSSLGGDHWPVVSSSATPLLLLCSLSNKSLEIVWQLTGSSMILFIAESCKVAVISGTKLEDPPGSSSTLYTGDFYLVDELLSSG